MIRTKTVVAAAVVLLSAGLLMAAHGETPSAPIALPTNDNALSLHFDMGVTPSVSTSSDAEAAALPDAPSATLHASYMEPAMASYARQDRVAPKYAADISPGWQAQPLSAHDKFIFGIRDTVSPFSFVCYAASAGYSHLTNGQPNYGTNSEAFAQRFGAAVARDATENILSESILAGAFHQDPRYYVMGDEHNFFERAIYAATRPIITRTDHGHHTLNSSLLLGYAGASAISYTYYPQINRNFHDTVATFGGALAGAAVGDVVAEFWDDALSIFHHKKN